MARADGGPGGRQRHHGVGLVPVQQGQAPADVRRHQPAVRRTRRSSSSSTARAAGRSRSSAASRPDANINNAIEVADIVDSTYNALVLQANKRFSQGSAVHRELHAVEVGGHRAELDDVHLELRDAWSIRSTTTPRRARPRSIGAIAASSASTTRPTSCGDSRFGGTGTFESGLPLNPTISINSGALTGTGVVEHRERQWHRRVEPRAVRHAQRLPADRPQDDRHACVEAVQCRRTPPDRGALGSVQHLQLDELHRLRHDQVPRRELQLTMRRRTRPS